MTEFRHILVVSIIVTVLAAVMSALAVAWTADHRMRTAMPLDRSGATAAIVVAAMCWLHIWRARHDEDKALLIKTVARTARRVQ